MGFVKKSIVTVDPKADPEKAFEQLHKAYRLLEERCGHVINEEGKISANLPIDIKCSTHAGDKNLSHLIQGLTSILVDSSSANGPGPWASLGASATLQSGTAYQCTAVTPDGLHYIGVRNKPSSSNGLLEIYSIVDGIVQAGVIGTIDSAKLRAADTQLIVVSPIGTLCAVVTVDSGDGNQTKLQIVNLSDKTSPALLGELDLANPPGTGTQALWDEARAVIYWPGKDATNHLFVFGVSVPSAPTLASTYTTSGLTTVIACVLSKNRNFLYMSGNGGVESASLSSSGTLAQDTTVLVANTWETLAHNGTVLATLVKTNNTTVNVWVLDWAASDQGTISTNTNNSVTGTYTNAGKFRNVSFIGDNLACSSGVPGTAGLFLVFDISNPAGVAEVSSTSIAALDSTSEVAVGGPPGIRYIQLGLNADVETWQAPQTFGAVIEVDQIGSTTTSKPPIVVASPMLVVGLNADMVDGIHAAQLALLDKVVLRDGTQALTADWDNLGFRIRNTGVAEVADAEPSTPATGLVWLDTDETGVTALENLVPSIYFWGEHA